MVYSLICPLFSLVNVGHYMLFTKTWLSKPKSHLVTCHHSVGLGGFPCEWTGIGMLDNLDPECHRHRVVEDPGVSEKPRMEKAGVGNRHS